MRYLLILLFSLLPGCATWDSVFGPPVEGRAEYCKQWPNDRVCK